MGLSFDMSQEEFVRARGMDCPLCGAEDGAESTDSGYTPRSMTVVTDNMMCSACDGRWKEIYTLSGYEKI